MHSWQIQCYDKTRPGWGCLYILHSYYRWIWSSSPVEKTKAVSHSYCLMFSWFQCYPKQIEKSVLLADWYWLISLSADRYHNQQITLPMIRISDLPLKSWSEHSYCCRHKIIVWREFLIAHMSVDKAIGYCVLTVYNSLRILSQWRAQTVLQWSCIKRLVTVFKVLYPELWPAGDFSGRNHVTLSVHQRTTANTCRADSYVEDFAGQIFPSVVRDKNS